MRFIVKHEIKGRLRIHLDRRQLTLREADLFCCALSLIPGVKEVKVYEGPRMRRFSMRTACGRSSSGRSGVFPFRTSHSVSWSRRTAAGR